MAEGARARDHRSWRCARSPKSRDVSIWPRHVLSLRGRGRAEVKEISYIHAEAMRRASQGTGRFALVDEKMARGS